jgi:hypothetical protein
MIMRQAAACTPVLVVAREADDEAEERSSSSSTYSQHVPSMGKENDSEQPDLNNGMGYCRRRSQRNRERPHRVRQITGLDDLMDGYVVHRRADLQRHRPGSEPQHPQLHHRQWPRHHYRLFMNDRNGPPHYHEPSQELDVLQLQVQHLLAGDDYGPPRSSQGQFGVPRIPSSIFVVVHPC